ncbi:flagellar basal body P-ring formation chaperone FlgA [Azospirillum halopraeferens]|uniref:flagellar basal body P-ring formation chaperone FlgA n=1 Tax=Azospirillum halopraeferens TaxID=34010 RepID=UPI0009FF96C3|nr:flagellar basal body P-ring formation chaperone FlgA [Azospirillum halopraeferens]
MTPRPRPPRPRHRRPAVPAALFGLALLLAGPAAAGPVENLLAEELRDTLGAAVPAGAAVTVTLGRPFDGVAEAVREFAYDPRNGSFRALVSSAGRLVELAGQVAVEVEVPVPVRRIAPGEIIAASDLALVRMPLDRLGGGFVTDADSLVGLSPRRQMAAGRLIRTGSVGAPIVVQRNRPVTLVYEDGALILAARGRALQDGGVGDLVRVMNIASNAVVTGTITGAETVSVNGPRVPGPAGTMTASPLP